MSTANPAPAARPVIIDTDPGRDDAVAILLALGSAELAVQALVAVHGNVPLAATERNARALLALAGRTEIGVHPGCARPLVRAPVHAPDVHGASGLGGLVLPEPTVAARAEDGVAYLVRTLLAAPAGGITLCLLGPATNLAAALAREPGIARGIAEVVLMAGATNGRGNVTAAAEFNAYADPEAARAVLRSGLACTLVPLDLTHRMRLTAPRLARLREVGTAAATAVARLFAGDAGSPMHDPCVIAHLLRPGLFRGEALAVDVEVAGELTRGVTVADRRGRREGAANATVLTDGDAEGLFGLLFERLGRLP